MSIITDIVLVTALAVSDTPATDVVPVIVETGHATSHTISAPAVVVLEAAAATDVATPSQFSVLLSTGGSVSTTPGSVVFLNVLVAERANAVSIAASSQAEQVTATGNAQSALLLNNSEEALSTAGAVSTIPTASTTSTVTLTDGAVARDTAIPGRLESVMETAAATDAAIPTRVVTVLVTDAGAGASSLPVVSGDVDPDLLVSAGAGDSTLLSQLDAQALLSSVADGDSSARFKNPAAVAWVLNTETTGAVLYDNFDFESVAQTPDKVLAVGPDGLFELVGATDAGETVDASFDTGFQDFGTANTKRVDTMYFGYTSTGGLTLTVETYGSGHPASTYTLEARTAPAPRNTRVTPGKGLSGRYWRMTISNVNGADFEIHDATVDMAVSTRRV